MKKYVLLVLLLGCSRDNASVSDTASAQVNSSSARSATQDARRTLTNDAPRALPGDARRTVLFIGTSLTAGYGLDPDSAYPQQIQAMIDSARLPYTVVNAGVSGETSSSLVRRIDWLLRQRFDVVVIETGANDGLRGIPIETMRSNIQQVIERIRASRPAARIALVQMEALPNLGRSYTQRFRAVFPELASRNKIVLLPFLLENVAGVRDLNQGDGIHPNYEGERMVAQNVWKGLKPLLQ